MERASRLSQKKFTTLNEENFKQRLPVLLVMLAGLLAAILAGMVAGQGDVKMILIPFALAGMSLVWFGLGDWIWVMLAASLMLRGKLTFLPGDIQPFEIMTALAFSKYLVEQFVFRKRRQQFGPPMDVFLIAGFMGILVYHAALNKMGMRVFGSDIWGGRGYVASVLGVLCYLMMISARSSPSILRHIPAAILLASGFDLVVSIATAQSAAVARAVAPFYSAISTLALEEDITQRIGAFGNFGAALVVFVLAKGDIRGVWRPERWGALLGLTLGTAAVFLSGYRSAVLGLLLIGLAAMLRDLRGRAIIPVALMACALFALPMVHDTLFRLPYQVQRAITFLPGKWDPDAAMTAADSTEWRLMVWKKWQDSEFPRHPWFGRGFGFRYEDLASQIRAEDMFVRGRDSQIERFVLVGELHNGLFSVVDVVGVVGATFFVIFCVRQLYFVLRVLLAKDVASQNPALRWVCLYLFGSILLYWIGALKMDDMMPPLMLLSGLFYRLRTDPERTAPPEPYLRPSGREGLSRAAGPPMLAQR